MTTHPFHPKRAIAAVALSATFTLGAGAATAAPNEETIVVAQATMAAPPVVVVRPYPDYMKRAAAAAAQGPDALRRYLWRTRGIYNFYYWDFVPQT
jgi:hypothetical protein